MDQFHWDFSKEEREMLDEAGRQSVIFLKEESIWEQSREAYWKENGWANMQYIFLSLFLIVCIM
jgi:hypothetical protein